MLLKSAESHNSLIPFLFDQEMSFDHFHTTLMIRLETATVTCYAKKCLLTYEILRGSM